MAQGSPALWLHAQYHAGTPSCQPDMYESVARHAHHQVSAEEIGADGHIAIDCGRTAGRGAVAVGLASTASRRLACAVQERMRMDNEAAECASTQKWLTGSSSIDLQEGGKWQLSFPCALAAAGRPRPPALSAGASSRQRRLHALAHRQWAVDLEGGDRAERDVAPNQHHGAAAGREIDRDCHGGHSHTA